MEDMGIATEKLRLSEISPRVMQSEIRSMTMECDRVGGVNLAQGVCDTEIPSSVVESAIKAIHDGHNIYTRLDGIAPLRHAIARKLAHYNGVNVDLDVTRHLRLQAGVDASGGSSVGVGAEWEYK